MYRVDPKDPRPVRVARRFVGDHLTSTADAIYFDQLEVANDVGLVSDLYRFDRRTEQVARLTCGARFGDPDVSPDGQRFAAVKSERGARSLVILTATWPVPCGQPASLFELSSPDMTYESPRWSPDGTHIAVARQIIHGPSEIVLVDALTGRVAVVDRSPSRNVTPAWMPDGRTIVFASDRDGVFNLFARQIRKTALGEIEPGPLARITTLEGGATFPDVSSDGRSLVFVGYTTAGYDLFTMPVDPAQWTMIPDAATPVSGVVSPARGAGTASNAPRESEPDPDMLDGPGRSLARYTPWGTLLPRSWLPAAELVGDDINIGGTTFGGDVLGRHAYSVSFLFPVRQSAQRLALQAARPEWFVSYAYDRWKPTFYAAASDTTDIVLERRDPADIKEHVDARERRFEVGLILPRRRVRSSHTWLAAIQLATRREATLAEVTTEDRHAFRLAWSFDTARQYGYSISHEDGISTTLTFERVTRAIGASGDATAATADVRGYFGVGPRHSILALRGAGGLSTGDERVRRTFSVGGSESRPASLAFGRESLALLRGFSPGDLAGTRAAVVNVEQRFALARIERGRGTWPLFLRTAHGALFADIGHAWDGRFSTGDLKRAFGGELSIDLVAGYFLPLTATAGVAWTYDRARERPSGRGVYVRFGRAF
jgi:dipeptidyl aminopeptidase/acylaminoacyl peptidase